jgi:hypothetical protein
VKCSWAAASRWEGFATFWALKKKKKMGRVGSPNIRKLSHLDAALCPREFHWILSPRKLQHLPDTGHSFGPLEHIMDTLNFVKKGKFMNCSEKFFIYSETKRGNQITKESVLGTNKISDVIIQYESTGCQLWLQYASSYASLSTVAPKISADKHHSTTTTITTTTTT